jgi:hypothetical protein
VRGDRGAPPARSGRLTGKANGTRLSRSRKAHLIDVEVDALVRDLQLVDYKVQAKRHEDIDVISASLKDSLPVRVLLALHRLKPA